MFSLFYNFGLHCYAGGSIPKLLMRERNKGESHRPLNSWFGGGFPEIDRSKGPVIWVHAVSLGETRAIAGLVKKIKKESPEATILFSSVTATGHAEVQKSLPEVDHAVYLPFDFPYVIGPLVQSVKPDTVIICETDYWYNFLKEAKGQGASIVVVNAKLSQQSAGWYRLFPPFRRHILELVDYYCIQDEIYAERFRKVGLPEGRLEVTGNLKYDTPPHKMTKAECEALSTQLGLGNSKVVCVGSTHEPEEELLLDSLLKIDAKVLLVPRHPERFDKVAEILESRQVPYGRYSQIGKLTGDEKVILIDAMRQLTNCYQVSDVAIVAGSYTEKVGGHNLLEPLWFGVPVLFGPHMHSQEAMTALVLRLAAGEQVEVEDLDSAVEKLLTNPEFRKAVVQGGKALLAEVKGSLDATWQVVSDFVRHESFVS